MSYIDFSRALLGRNDNMATFLVSPFLNIYIAKILGNIIDDMAKLSNIDQFLTNLNILQQSELLNQRCHTSASGYVIFEIILVNEE